MKATTVTQPDRIPQDRFKCLTPTDLSEDEQDSVIRLAFEVLAARHQPGTVLSSPQDTRLYLRLQVGEYRAEVFGVLSLDSKHRVLRFEEMFQGTIDGASVHPRVIVQRALIEPHEDYLRLGRELAERQAVYRDSFRVHIDPALLKAVRQATQTNRVFGAEYFQKQIEAALALRIAKRKPGPQRRENLG